jgi:hypothetical protein
VSHFIPVGAGYGRKSRIHLSSSGAVPCLCMSLLWRTFGRYALAAFELARNVSIRNNTPQMCRLNLPQFAA